MQDGEKDRDKGEKIHYRRDPFPSLSPSDILQFPRVPGDTHVRAWVIASLIFVERPGWMDGYRSGQWEWESGTAFPGPLSLRLSSVGDIHARKHGSVRVFLAPLSACMWCPYVVLSGDFVCLFPLPMCASPQGQARSSGFRGTNADWRKEV